MGALDFMDGVANTLVNAFVDGRDTWTRRVAGAYVPTTGADPVVETTETIKTTPPAPFKDSQIGRNGIRTGDVMVVMDDIELQRVAPFDPFPTTDATVTVVVGAETFKVINFQNFNSGDKNAAYEFQLRK